MSDQKRRALDAPFTTWEHVKFTVGGLAILALPLVLAVMTGVAVLYWAGLLTGR